MNLLTRIITAGLVLPLLAACGHSDSKGSEATFHNVFVISPEVASGGNVRSYPAKVEEARSISVGFKTPGQIKRILVKEGDHVRAGQLLAVLDTVDYALGVRTLRVQLAQMRSEHERLKQLFATGNITANDYEKASAGLRQLELQLKMNQNKLDYCRLYAPASGVITAKNFENSEMVDAGTPVFELMDNNHLEVVVDLPVSAYMQRANFRGFTATSPHLPGKSYQLSMLSLTPKADNNQLYQLKLTLPSTDVQLTPGQNLNVEILTEDGALLAGAAEQATDIPLSAIVEQKGRPGVWALNPKDSTINFTPVEISGTGEEGKVRVVSGLAPGITIVRAGVHHLKEGEKVKVIKENSATNLGNLL